MSKKEKPAPKFPEIGERLTQFIEQSGEPNARQFALKADLTPQLVSHLCQGYSMPSAETLIALAKTYKMFDATWLLTGKHTRAVLTPDPTPKGEPTASVAASETESFTEGEAKMPATVKRKYDTPMAVLRDVEEMTPEAQAAYYKTLFELADEELTALKNTQRHEEAVRLVKSAGGRSFTNASADAANDDCPPPVMVAETIRHDAAAATEVDRIRIRRWGNQALLS